MQNIEQLYARRDLSVTVFRAGLLALAGAGLATVYLLAGYGAVSATYGGVCLVITAVLFLGAALVAYVPTQRVLSASGVRGRTILRHLPTPTGQRKREERDILDELERDLDF